MVTHVPSYAVGRADLDQLPKTPSPRWYGLVSGSCARFWSLQPSFTSMTFAEAPKARAMSAGDVGVERGVSHMANQPP